MEDDSVLSEKRRVKECKHTYHKQSGRSYIPGKPLSSDLRHIIIDKIIDGGGNPLTMIFPGRFVNLVSVEHASVLACEPLLPSQPCIPVSTAGEANSKTLILMFLAPFSNKPFVCKAEILSGQIYRVESLNSSFGDGAPRSQCILQTCSIPGS